MNEQPIQQPAPRRTTRAAGLRRTLRVAATLLVIAAFLYALLLQAGAIASYRWSADPAFLVPACVMALLRGGPVVFPWWRIIRGWSNREARLSLGKAARIYFHAALARYMPGQWWFVPARITLAERAGVRRAVAAAATGMETVVVTSCALSVAALGSATVAVLPTPARLGLLALGLVLPVLIVSSPSLVVGVLNRLLVARGYERVSSSLARRDTLLAVSAAYLNWLMYGCTAALLLQGMGGNIPESTPAVIGLFAASVLGGSLSLVVPQGLFVREGVLVTLLHVALGVPVTLAVVVAAATRLLTSLADGVWAGLALRFR